MLQRQSSHSWSWFLLFEELKDPVQPWIMGWLCEATPPVGQQSWTNGLIRIGSVFIMLLASFWSAGIFLRCWAVIYFPPHFLLDLDRKKILPGCGMTEQWVVLGA